MLPTTSPALPGTSIDPNLPDSDDLPMGETDFHTVAVIWLRQALEDHFAAAADVYVASTIMLYYEWSDSRYHLDPDVVVTKGVGKHLRRSFRTWEENTVPRVVFEISSNKTWQLDHQDKSEIYERLGVAEYFCFDPEGRLLKPPLQGMRLVKGKYVRLRPAGVPSLCARCG
jgi:Uma2 family endonuclease